MTQSWHGNRQTMLLLGPDVKARLISRATTSIPLEEALTHFCQRWKVSEFYVFGSVLRHDFGPDSDIDVMVQFSSDAQWSLFDFVDIKQNLEAILGREVDLLTKKSVEKSENWIRRQEILDKAQLLYVQG